MYRKILICLLLWIAARSTHAQNTPLLWKDTKAPARQDAERMIIPEKFRVLQLDTDKMRALLAGAPSEEEGRAGQSDYLLELPTPDGEMETFRIVESPIMEPGLAARFPKIKTYLGKGLRDASALLRMDITHRGIHAMVLAAGRSYFIDPYYHLLNDGTYLSYFRSDYEEKEGFHCLTEGHSREMERPSGSSGQVGEELRRYRIAVSTTGEYTQFHGGTVEDGLAAVVVSMNRVNGIYERDISVRMILVDSNFKIIYTDPADDPFSGDFVQLRNQNQNVLDQNIGSENYDVGHVFHRAGNAGVASLFTVCVEGEKGLGMTGTSTPVSDPFDVDYVAHELGHMFGGLHTFNNCSGSQGNEPYEPGSATTIMGYAGICGATNIAMNSNDHFHVGNLDDMIPFTLIEAGNTCPEKIPTENTPPLVEAGLSGHIIPISTPFELTGEAFDEEGDSLTYSWEQFDIGPGTTPNNPSGNAPLFRSFALSNNPTRVFPQPSDIINNRQTIGEILPDYARTMTFRLTVRDNHGFGGGVEWDERNLAVTDEAGPFKVISQEDPTRWKAGSFQTIEWEVAHTDQEPVNAQTVDIYLSDDGGLAFPYLIAEALPNNGSALVIVPDTLSGNRFRVKVKASDNVFFDMNDADITVSQASAPGLSLGVLNTEPDVCGSDGLEVSLFIAPILGFEGTASLSVAGLPAGVTASIDETVEVPGQARLAISNTDELISGIYPVKVIARGEGAADSLQLLLRLFASAPQPPVPVFPGQGAENVPIRTEFLWQAAPFTRDYQLEVAYDEAFEDIVVSEEGIEGTSFELATELQDSSLVFWRIRSRNPGCGYGPYITGSFFTEVVNCKSFLPAELPVSLDVAAPLVVSIVEVEEELSVRAVRIKNLQGTHTPLSSINFRFTGPEGPVLDLITEDCNLDTLFNLSLDSEAPLPYSCARIDDGGTYQPDDDLKVYSGLNAQGRWRLVLFKSEANGSLDNWELELCFSEPLTSLRERDQGPSQLTVFPNPAGDQLSVRLPQSSLQGGRLAVSSAAGQLLGQFPVEGRNTQQLDVGGLPAGLYFLQLYSAEGELVGNSRFVKR